MAQLPLRTQVFDAFLGLQEGIHSVILPDLYSPGGSQNLYIDQFGRARAILGYSKQNSTAITTDTAGDATSVVDLFAYRSLAAGGDTRRLRAVVDDGTNEWEVWTSSDEGATWTFLKDFGSGPVGNHADYTQFGDEGYLATGDGAVQLDDGSSLADAGGTQSPTPSAAVGSAGALQGNYQYKLVSLIAGARQIGSAASTSVLLNNEQADLTWTADVNTNVDGYEVYRTSGTGKVYYYVTTIDGRTTVAHTDNTPDLLILENRVLEEHGDAPPSGVYLVATHQQRMWYARTDANPRTLWYSDPGDADSVYEENNFDLTDGDSIGDKITAIRGGFESGLVAFHERSIWLVSGTGQTIGDINDWVLTRTNARTGAVSQRAHQRIPAGAVYTDQKGNFQTTSVSTLAFFTPLGDIRLFDGDNDLIVSFPVQTTLATLNFSFRSNVISFADPARNEVGWIVPTGSSSTPDTAVVWNHAYGVWYVRTPFPFSSILATDSTSEGEILLAGQADSAVGGFVYKLWSGATFDGTAIKVQWMTKTLYGADDAGRPDLSSTKRWRWVDLVTQAISGVTFNLEWISGNSSDTAAATGSRSVSPSAVQVLTADGSTIDTTSGSEIQVSVSSTTLRIRLIDANGDYLHDKGIRLRMVAESDQGQWALEGMIVAWQQLPGLNRGL